LDTVGILAPTAECASLAFAHLNDAAKDDGVTDSTMVFRNTTKMHAVKEENSLRVGIPSAFSVEECPQAITAAWEEAATALEQNGATLVELPSDLISPELIRHSLAAYYILASAEASSNLSRYDGLRYGLSIDEDDVSAVAAAMTDLTQLERQYASTRSRATYTQWYFRAVLRSIPHAL
jgi:aspartyl-tRNA(Asn)/glutamyl-tRNA(Gln) amidotransferase subunit A